MINFALVKIIIFTMKKIDIRKLNPNPDNPRTMSEFMEGKLIESILVFPKMLELRPILINKDNVIVGGNGRVECLNKILNLDNNEIEDYLFNQKKFRMSSEEDKTALLDFWAKWKEKHVTFVRVLDDVTAEEEKEILVKDNLHYGEDDIEIMKQHFERESIGDYLGSVAWNLYDYSDKINDQNLDLTKTYPEKFRCGYVECQMTDQEFKGLCARLDEYLQENEGISDGFLTALLLGK